MQGSGNTIPQGSECLLYSGDQIPWWQQPHNQGQGHQVYWSGKDKGTVGVRVFVAEEWIQKEFEVQRVSNRIILVKFIVGQHMVTFLSMYEGPAKSFVTGFGLLQCYILSNIFLLQTFKVFPL